MCTKSTLSHMQICADSLNQEPLQRNIFYISIYFYGWFKYSNFVNIVFCNGQSSTARVVMGIPIQPNFKPLPLYTENFKNNKISICSKSHYSIWKHFFPLVHFNLIEILKLRWLCFVFSFSSFALSFCDWHSL